MGLQFVDSSRNGSKFCFAQCKKKGHTLFSFQKSFIQAKLQCTSGHSQEDSCQYSRLHRTSSMLFERKDRGEESRKAITRRRHTGEFLFRSVCLYLNESVCCFNLVIFFHRTWNITALQMDNRDQVDSLE